MSAFDNYIQLLDKIDAFAAGVMARHPASFRCGPGCSKCCVAGITMWRVEADHIKGYIESPEFDIPSSLRLAHVPPGPVVGSPPFAASPQQSRSPCTPRERLLASNGGPPIRRHPEAQENRRSQGLSNSGDQCTYLNEQGLCSIYPVRPAVCRLWGAPLLIPAGREAEWGIRASSSAPSGRGTIVSCDLNFTGSPSLAELAKKDILNVETALTALAAINHLYCRAVGADPEERTPLSSIA
ncbi:MAG: YkgJ family cysteine cluster protein [Proteobacteria bacterium]|nr:YkgJ family cysteine cluster protein [Pseudomonadota bacterium]